MKKLILTLVALTIISLTHAQAVSWQQSNLNTTSRGVMFINPNPSSDANFQIDWLNDVARIRVGGPAADAGSTSGFDIQGMGNASLLRLLNNGNVGIGTTKPSELLTVKGKILCSEVEVVINGDIPDYVFQKYYTGFSSLKEDYKMPTLEEVEAFVKENHHLPEVPSAADFKEEGMQLKEMTTLLLQKIEELTLYTIEQEKRIKALETKLELKQ